MTENMNRYGRVGEIFCALIDVSPTDEIRNALIDFAQGVFEDQREEEAASFDGEVVRAVVNCLDQAEGSLLPIKFIVEEINEDRAERDRIKPQKVGWALARLGFKKGRMPDGKGTYAVVLDRDLIGRLVASFDVRETEALSVSVSSKGYSEPQMLRGQNEAARLASEHSEHLSKKGETGACLSKVCLKDSVQAGIGWISDSLNLDDDGWGDLARFTQVVSGPEVVQHMIREGLTMTHPTKLNKVRLVRRK